MYQKILLFKYICNCKVASYLYQQLIIDEAGIIELLLIKLMKTI